MSSSMQLNLPPAPLQDVSHERPVRKIVSQPADLLSIVRDACDACEPRLTGLELALVLGQSESLVSRKLSPHHRETFNLDDLNKFPDRFWSAFHRGLGEQKGLRRAALVRVVAAVSDLALAVGE